MFKQENDQNISEHQNLEDNLNDLIVNFTISPWFFPPKVKFTKKQAGFFKYIKNMRPAPPSVIEYPHFIANYSKKVAYICNVVQTKMVLNKLEMKKLTTTILAVAGIVLGSAVFAAKKDGKEVLVKSTESGKKVELTYLSESACKVKVNIYDEAGNKIFADAISNPKSFKKSYDLSNLPVGEYEFEIIDSEKVVVEKISNLDVKTTSKVLKATVIKEADDKFKVLVRGEIANPVAVNIYDLQGKLIFGDLIDHEKSFSKIYDLSKTFKKDVKFEIVQNGQILASASF